MVISHSFIFHIEERGAYGEEVASETFPEWYHHPKRCERIVI